MRTGPAPECAAAQPAAAPVPTPPARPTTVDFVCEEDVRTALRQKQKIFIGPKSIVTPSARDLASQYDILIATHSE